MKQEGKVYENFLRRKAERLGLRLAKSRAKEIHVDDMGGWRILNARENYVVAGSRFEYSIEDVAEYLDEAEKELIKERKRA